MYTPRRTKLQFKIIFEEDPVPIASAQQYHIYIIQIFICIYFLKRKIMESVLQNTPNCTIDKKSWEYAPIPLNIVCAVIHYLLFLYKKMNIFTIFFLILAKYSPKRTKLHHFLKFSQTRLANAWLCHALHGASRHANTPTFTKIF